MTERGDYNKLDIKPGGGNIVKKNIDILFGVLLLALIIYLAWFPKSWFWENGTILLGWILFVLQSLYSRGDKLYWFVQKVKYSIINPDTQWDLTVRYSGQKVDATVIPAVQVALAKAAIFDRAVVRNISEQRIEIKADELTMEVYIEDQSLQVMFTKIPVTFRGSNRTIDKRITPALEELEACLAIEEKSYWLTVYFGTMNPYFGLYIRRLGQQNVTEMNIRINNNGLNQLEINKQKLTISTTTLNELGATAKKYLTLSHLPA